MTNKQKSVSVETSHSRLSPHDIAAARERLSELDFLVEPAEDVAAPVLDDEMKALIQRAEDLLSGDSLNETQKTLLQTLLEDIDDAENLAELDDLVEELLDALFDLE